MKTYRLLIMVVMAIFCVSISAQKKVTPNDSVMNVVKIKLLTEKKAKLKSQIAIEDAKRNEVVNGVTSEVQEALNDKQDSICLGLRSQLVAVELELKEFVPEHMVSTIVGQLNFLHQKQQSDSGTVVGEKMKK